ncbi:hypothetical protein RIF29_07776 [Crotalaria pallida]|uniref:Phenylalanyl tRNA synthetase beta chain core domain-containing protein n=1 Tax=Crotalaria pallida TaxID=3830 RepID=A0AAN9J4G4_CROPI
MYHLLFFKRLRKYSYHEVLVQIFEVGDIAILDDKKDVRAKNLRQLAALYCGANAGLEIIYGLVDRVMEKNGAPFVSSGDTSGYYIERSDEQEFLSGRQAKLESFTRETILALLELFIQGYF